MFVIQFKLMFVGGIETDEGQPRPSWTPTLELALRFETREEALVVMGLYPEGSMMQGAEVVPVES